MIHSIPAFVTQDRPRLFSSSLFQVIVGSLFIALCSQIKVLLPFSMVPLTLQTLAVLMLGGVFGSRKSAWMVLLHFFQIAWGLPVLAGGAVNPLAFIGPKAGYIFGFLVQAYCFGWLVERTQIERSARLFFAGLLACAIQLSMGTCWLATFVGWDQALWMGFFPFIPGEILKVLVVISALKKIKSLN